MPETIVHGVQFFVTKNGKLAQGRFVECKTSAEACRLAANRVRAGQATGAAAFVRKSFSEEFDDGSEPVTLATFGRVPPSLIDQIPF